VSSVSSSRIISATSGAQLFELLDRVYRENPVIERGDRCEMSHVKPLRFTVNFLTLLHSLPRSCYWDAVGCNEANRDRRNRHGDPDRSDVLIA
jgi:hypothetical protein